MIIHVWLKNKFTVKHHEKVNKIILTTQLKATTDLNVSGCIIKSLSLLWIELLLVLTPSVNNKYFIHIVELQQRNNKYSPIQQPWENSYLIDFRKKTYKRVQIISLHDEKQAVA